ncbi:MULTISPECIES: inorganic phosphate transporter [Sorangium]|uniref:Inorganic phosphate transporter n=1 Tax=Sorangium atrum TaxID=2995308 RepID=A0ABT5C6Q6_9BACT|nr:inorganic phosphate transporter [Sorangium aterium]MDC0681505.1 inorganic phosphate transporter [Sorangium aterium]
MNTLLVTLTLVIVVALVFDYINGFHDTANAIATVVSTGVLPIRTAVMLAALFNFGGALTGTAVASTIGKGLIVPSAVTQVVVLSALVGAIFWNLFTWYFGIPSSSSHALVGGLVGAGAGRAGTAAVQGAGLLKVVKSLVISPLVGFVISFFGMIAIFWIVRRTRPAVVNRRFRTLQMVSAGFMALSHGSNDAQKTMGIITMSLVAYGVIPAGHGDFHVPLWVVFACATAMALGTAAGGVRIIKTMGTKIIDLKPIHGFAAETSAAATILTSSFLGMPVSTTHVITGCIMGAGASQRVSAVRWGVTTRILWAWVLTIPVSAVVAWACYRGLSSILGG